MKNSLRIFKPLLFLVTIVERFQSKLVLEIN